MIFTERPRRLRASAAIREMVQETRLETSDLVWPAFIKAEGKDEPIASLPGCSRLPVTSLVERAKRLHERGLKAIALFPQIDEKNKDARGSESKNPNGLVPAAVKALKKALPDLVVITDVALDPYSSDGHDGLVKDGAVLNDETVAVLAEQALMQAEAGADFVAPSDMMDGRVGWIRKTLDENRFTGTGILAYTAKYASCFYGPFRDALQSAPKFGDKKTYQMNPLNVREALREARLDQLEGADILMVKPALCYLDVIRALKSRADVPIAAYNVSGEYAMVKAAAANGWLDGDRAMLEMLGSMKRAGASMIFTYFTPEILERKLL
ncbi:MAG TPA: porphobilinogen synthase [Bdellovibrionales bacterium]|nr:porphobilinogen synthase [Bdellovibrionales bacterium]